MPKWCTTDLKDDQMDELEEIRKRKIEQMKTDLGKTSADVSSGPVEVTDSSIDVFVKDHQVAVIDCWAPWCGPCRMIAPIIESLSNELQGKVSFGKLNTDENQMTAMRQNIAAIPTLLVFKNGRLVDRIVGAIPKEQILRRIQKFM